jgi:hypothetical protein
MGPAVFQSLHFFLHLEIVRDCISRRMAFSENNWDLPMAGYAMQGGHVALFTIFLGANDAVTANWTDAKGQPIKTEHVPIPRYTANLKRMVAMLRQHQPQAEIVIITPPKVSAEEASWLYYVEVFFVLTLKTQVNRAVCSKSRKSAAKTKENRAPTSHAAPDVGTLLSFWHRRSAAWTGPGCSTAAPTPRGTRRAPGSTPRHAPRPPRCLDTALAPAILHSVPFPMFC